MYTENNIYIYLFSFKLKCQFWRSNHICSATNQHIDVVCFSHTCFSHFQCAISPLGPKANWHSHVFNVFWKAKRVEADLTSAHLAWLGREGMLWTPQQLVVSRKRSFSAVALRGETGPTLPVFQKGVKTWLSGRIWGMQRSTQSESTQSPSRKVMGSFKIR